MNIDDYLNDLQNNLDDQLSRFGVSDQPMGNMFSTEDTEEKKFCPECGNKVAVDSVSKMKMLLMKPWTILAQKKQLP